MLKSNSTHKKFVPVTETPPALSPISAQASGIDLEPGLSTHLR